MQSLPKNQIFSHTMLPEITHSEPVPVANAIYVNA